MEELKYHYKYPHPSVTTDCVIFGYDGLVHDMKVLLIKRGREPYKGKWAFPGGFLNIDESAEDCALRELYEETGLHAAHVKQLHTFSEPGRDPRERVISIAYYSFVCLQDVKGQDDVTAANWFRLDDIPPLAFDHEQMLKVAVKVIRREALFNIIGGELLGDKFSLDELRRIYEAVFCSAINKDAFYKWVVGSGRVISVQEFPGYYKFNSVWKAVSAVSFV